ncbi:replicative DNA helicase [Chitiniphilus shinanonensis]|uniref:replicative DNA helicase n=1 Tax=Chitiniphilus shinanonensis TaxID=553088 RepID=UPI0030248519
MSLELEYSLLSSLMADASRLATLDLHAADFSTPLTRSVFEQIERHHRHGIQPDMFVVWEGLQVDGHGDAVSLGDVSQIYSYPGQVANQAFYARSVKLAAKRTAIADLGIAITAAASDDSDDMPSRIQRVRDAVAEFEARSELLPPALEAAELTRVTLESLDRLWRSDDAVVGISTGLSRLDNLTHGLQDGELIIVAGRPSMGKTLLGQHMAVAAAKRQKRVHFISLEMDLAKIGQRMLASLADVPLSEILSGRFTSRVHKDRFEEAAQYLPSLPLRMSDQVAAVAKIASLARRERLSGGLDLLVVDQLSAMPIRGDNRATGLKQITGELKRLAKELQIPIVLLHQINREAGKGQDRRPDIHQLKDSGAVEEDADIVLMIHREAYYDNRANPEEAEIIVGKHRSGQRGATARVGLNLATCRFSDYPPSWSPQQQAAARDEDFAL